MFAGFNVNGAVVEVDPSKVMLIDPHYYQLLDMAILVPGQRRIEVERRDLVFLEIRSDYLVSLLSSKHCSEFLSVRPHSQNNGQALRNNGVVPRGVPAASLHLRRK